MLLQILQGRFVMFMYHENLSLIENQYGSRWKGINAPTAGEVAKIILKYPNSHCLWAHGIRKIENFRKAMWLGLDFDEGLSLEDAIKIFDPYMHVIATTRNHQKTKGNKPPCDRFRVFVMLSEIIRDADQLTMTIDELVKKHGCDEQAKDAARKWNPCKEIIVSKYIGKPYKPVNIEIVKERKRITNERIAKRTARLNAYYVPGKVIPPQARVLLDHGTIDGDRNEACFRVSRDLKKVGYTESEALELIWNSPIPIDRSDKVFREIKDVVRRVYSKGL
jgi:hypothetical protein